VWRVHYYEGEQEVFQSFDQWHQNGLEFEVSNFFGLSCQGTWIHKGPGTVQLFHTGWNFDANGQLTGYFNEVQTVTVSVDGQAYDGTFLVVFANFSCERRTVQNPTPSIAIRSNPATAADLSRKAVLACFNFACRAEFPSWSV
jgi:hypothetical protein